MNRRRCVTALVVTALLAACTTDTTGTADDARVATTAPLPSADDEVSRTGSDPRPVDELDGAAFEVSAGTEQVTVVGAEPGEDLTLVDGDGFELVTARADAYGSLLFRELRPAAVHRVRSATAISPPVTTRARDEHPTVSFYAEQRLPSPGFGYLTTRDGTTLSVDVRLPGSVDDGPYPTVVEYSGYTPSDPDTSGIGDLFVALGYAYVGVNIRGTGCSGGSFRYFEYSQSLDGYDAIETIAAQPWVDGVGMIGVSYPGISQLFVARTQPPSLDAITPLSVLDDSLLGTLAPGGILNTGFAVPWTAERMESARPEGQAWSAARIADGDETCAANQRLRLQNPDLLAEIRATPYWVSPLGDELAPRTFVDQIEVPVMLAGAWQDEQTGGRFPTMLDRFTGTDRLFVSLVNGLHTESVSPVILARVVEFLDLYVARRTPALGLLRLAAPAVGGGIFGTTDFEVPPDRFEGMTHADALAAFEAEGRIQVLFEQGAADGRGPRTPMPRFEARFGSWPPGTDVVEWYLHGDPDHADAPSIRGRLERTAPVTDPDAPAASTDYLALPDGVPATYYDGSSSGIWRVDVDERWVEPAPGTTASFATDPLTEDLVLVGSSSADLWIRSNTADTDLEVTLSDLRPDGTEILVQSGWLRASRRHLDLDASTPTRPVHTHVEVDSSPLPEDAFAPVRVEIFPVAHVFRAGSRLRLTIDAPGGDRAVWRFETISGGERVTIAHDASHPSRLVIPVARDVPVPPGEPACGSLRGQPCRTAPASGG